MARRRCPTLLFLAFFAASALLYWRRPSGAVTRVPTVPSQLQQFADASAASEPLLPVLDPPSIAPDVDEEEARPPPTERLICSRYAGPLRWRHHPGGRNAPTRELQALTLEAVERGAAPPRAREKVHLQGRRWRGRRALPRLLRRRGRLRDAAQFERPRLGRGGGAVIFFVF